MKPFFPYFINTDSRSKLLIRLTMPPPSHPKKTLDLSFYPVKIYLVKVNNRNTRKRCEICSKLTIKTLDVTDVVQVFLLLTLNVFHTFF